MVKNLSVNTGDVERHRFSPWVGKIPGRRAQPSTPIFLPEESHGQRRLTSYSPGSHRVRHE